MKSVKEEDVATKVESETDSTMKVEPFKEIHEEISLATSS